MLDIVLNQCKWAIIGPYRPYIWKQNLFPKLCIKGLDKISTQFDNVYTLGALAYLNAEEYIVFTFPFVHLYVSSFVLP